MNLKKTIYFGFLIFSIFFFASLSYSQEIIEKKKIALILPFSSKKFKIISEALQKGINYEILKRNKSNFIIESFDSTDNFEKSYDQALSIKPIAIIGPLKNSSSKKVLSYRNNNFNDSKNIPIVSFKKPEIILTKQKNIFFLERGLIDETKYLSELILEEGGEKVLIIKSELDYFSKLSNKFIDKWTELNGKIGEQLTLSKKTNLLDVKTIIQNSESDTIFLCTNYNDSRLLRPFLGTRLPIYSLSITNFNDLNNLGRFDLEGVKFYDIPLFLTKNYDFLLSKHKQSNEYFRFFSLGADSIRLIDILIKDSKKNFGFSGLSGIIKVENGEIIKSPIPMTFINGKIFKIKSN